MRYALHILILLASAAGLAAGTNSVRVHRLPWYVPRDRVYPQPTPEQRAAEITREEVLAATERGVVLIDTREPMQYEKGHIPGSINIPAPKDGEPFDLNQVFTYAAPEDALIVYCSGEECEDSRNVFDVLKQTGFQNVRLYFGGWRDWTRAGLQVEQ